MREDREQEEEDKVEQDRLTSDQMRQEKKKTGQEVRDEVRWDDFLDDNQRCNELR